MNELTEIQTLQAQVILGDDAEKFLKTELGKYLVGASEIEAKESLDELKVTDPTDSKKITELQNKIWRAESFHTWLAELINAGHEALGILQSKQEN